MKHENENSANLHPEFRRREFMAMLAGCTFGLMVPSLSHGEGKIVEVGNSESIEKKYTSEKVIDAKRKAIMPGLIDTSRTAAFIAKEIGEAHIQKNIPLQRPGSPQEVADAVLFFASDRSSFCTGQVLSVSGGLTMAG